MIYTGAGAFTLCEAAAFCILIKSLDYLGRYCDNIKKRTFGDDADLKLKTRLKLSFFLIALLPIMFFTLAFCTIVSYQVRNIEEHYDIEGTSWNSIINPVEILTKVVNHLHDNIRHDIENNPGLLEDRTYYDEITARAQEKGADIAIRKDGEYVYISNGISMDEAEEILPDFGDINNTGEKGIYYGGNNRCIVSQIDYCNSDGVKYSISIMLYLNGIMPRLKRLFTESIISVVVVMIIISATMTYWIYITTIIPLNRLKEAARNISDGNLDFVIEAERDDEIGELCKDFEFMRQKLKESAEENIRSDKESKELISNISHDLKTPITAIKGYVEGLRDGVADTEEKRNKYLRTIYNKAIEVDRLIDELTLYSKIDTNRIPYSFNNLSVREYFDDYSDSLAAELESRDVDFGYVNEVEPGVEFIVDAEQMGRVINNIVSNSLKYHADRRIRIDMRIKDEGDFIRVEIADNGKGISKNDIPHIFERMYRADASRNSATGGSGIGLAVVKKIIEEHGGKIWAESREGIGTTMCFVLRKYIRQEDNHA